MSRVIAIANQKGGVGKTTTTVNLSAALANMQKRVLLIDLDPQGNATMGCGVDKYEVEKSVFDVLVDGMSVAEASQPSPENQCDVLPSNADLTAAEVELMSMDQREQRLKIALVEARSNYDYILIDCPPSLNILTLNAFVAADSVLVPIQCEYYALEGLSALLETIEGVRETVNSELEIEGLLRTMYDGRNRLGVEVSAQLLQHFGDQVFRTVVPRNVRLAEAPSHGISIMQYDKTSRGALAYLALAGEILRQRSRAEKSTPVTTASVAAVATPAIASVAGTIVSEPDQPEAIGSVDTLPVQEPTREQHSPSDRDASPDSGPELGQELGPDDGPDNPEQSSPETSATPDTESADG